MITPEKRPIHLTGEKIVEGIAIGKVFFIDKDFSLIPHLTLRGGQKAREKERRRFTAAVKKCEKELVSIMEERHLPKEATSILEAHRMMLVDPELSLRIGETIMDRAINAEWAVLLVFDEMMAHLSSSDGDYYLRAKVADLEVIRDKLLFSLLGGAGRTSYIKDLPTEDFVLCAHGLTLSDLSSLAKDPHLRGIALETPGGVSHLTIVLRSLGLPTVLGADGLLTEVVGCDEAVVDGLSGRVILSPSSADKSLYLKKKQAYDDYFDRFLHDAGKPALSRDGSMLHIGANIENVEDVEPSRRYGADFIGLFRTELMFLEKGDIPTEDDHYAVYYEMLHRAHPMEVTIRVFDFGGDKEGGIHATGAMGLRGIRFCFLYPDVFLPQVRGLIRAASLGNLRILLPFVSAVDEIHEFKAILKEQAKDLRLEKNLKHIKIGAMIELPAALFIAEMLAREVDFFSIGTNDLVQYLMAVERQDKALSQYFSHFHPAVLRALYNLYHIAKKARIDLSVCGEMGGDPYFTLLFMGMGIHALSMTPLAIPMVKKIIRSSSVEEGRALLNRLLMTASEMELRETLEKEMEQRYPDIFRKEWIDNIRKGG